MVTSYKSHINWWSPWSSRNPVYPSVPDHRNYMGALVKNNTGAQEILVP